MDALKKAVTEYLATLDRRRAAARADPALGKAVADAEAKLRALSSTPTKQRHLSPAVAAERERCAQLVDALVVRRGEGYIPTEDVRGIARRIRGQHADWCKTKYREPCNCGLEK